MIYLCKWQRTGKTKSQIFLRDREVWDKHTQKNKEMTNTKYKTVVAQAAQVERMRSERGSWEPLSHR